MEEVEERILEEDMVKSKKNVDLRTFPRSYPKVTKLVFIYQSEIMSGQDKTMTLRSEDIMLKYKNGKDLDNEITADSFAENGTVAENGTFNFKLCDICMGPKIGHVWDEQRKCTYKEAWKKEEAQRMVNKIISHEKFEEAVFRLRKGEEDLTCCFCNEKMENRWAKKDHYRKIHKKDLDQENNDYMATAMEQLKNLKVDQNEIAETNKSILLLLSKLVDTTLTQNTTNNRPITLVKAQRVPVWSKNQKLERWLDQVKAWVEDMGNVPVHQKYNELIESLKANKEIEGLSSYTTTTIMKIKIVKR